MRAPFQILAIPYKIENGKPLYCVLHRSDMDVWQFIAGGGEDSETPVEAAKREIFEEAGITVTDIIPLKSLCSIPTSIFSDIGRFGWTEDTYVIPEYTFAFRCDGGPALSHEHTEYVWMPYDEAAARLRYDSNRTVLYELDRRIAAGKLL